MCRTIGYRCRKTPWPLAIAVAGAVAVSSGMNNRAIAQTRVAPAPALGVSISPDAVGPGDLIDVSVSYCPELTKNFRVGSDGTLSLPLLRDHLVVAGSTPSEVSRNIRAALEKDNILVDPIVNVSVVEYRSRTVSVVGAVNHPTTFQATGGTTLIDALARAEGLSPTAGSTIVVTTKDSRGRPSGGDVAQINISDLLAGVVPEANLKLHGGEEIRVSEGKKIFVAGNVRRPGMYPMQSDSDTTVVKALALSSGLDLYSQNVAFIYRKNGDGPQRQEIQVSLKKILNHHSPDVALMADDILYIPTSESKRLTGKILNQIAGFGQTAESGLLVTR